MATRDPFDPALYRPEAISEETRAFNETLRRSGADAPRWWQMSLEAARGGLMPQPPRSSRAETREIAGLGGGTVGLRVVAPATPKGVYLHIHGGGLVMGAADRQDGMLERIADNTGLAAVSVEYRLAPEHPHPAAWDDCEAAALWLAERGKAEFGSSVLAIGGESTGATLAVPTILRLRDRHGFTGFSGAVLNFGVYDSSATPSVPINGELGLLLRTVDIQKCTEAYCPDVATRRDPDVSALYARLHDLPRALFTVGTLDPFIDDTLFLHARWIAAGNPAELQVFPGGCHGFIGFPLAIAAEANRRIDGFLAGLAG